ncbi:hypothetical protein COLINT_03458 [Collinsella intestinalis DSM 13280]|uniref:Uncharacterized protein n=1 Tax=Collinsella intestinalis DSM 13280 TaxID=521003 RepID=C4FBJ8_9ACTN|nr:hypothetical protein COLINT_03458 [Collinsella intestinalis DSM 13280]
MFASKRRHSSPCCTQYGVRGTAETAKRREHNARCFASAKTKHHRPGQFLPVTEDGACKRHNSYKSR